MKINLGNVNISLKEFQEVSEGVHNAGEVKLSDENTLTKMNNHVTVKFLNRDKISHSEVIAIKEALVKALEGGGVDKGVTNVLGGIKAGAEERGPIEELFVVAISRCRPGLDQKLEAFFARPSMMASQERFTATGDIALHARKFLNLVARQ